LFLWVTTRRRLVGIGYGWLLRGTYGVMAAIALWAGLRFNPVPVREVATAGVLVATTVALVVSVVRRRAGVAGPRAVEERRRTRVAAATGTASPPDEDEAPRPEPGPEFPPALDLVAPVLGFVGLVAAALAADGPSGLSLLRTLVGAAFLGSVSDAMLLGHWYLVQPGLGRGPINELNRWLQILWPVEVAALLLPTGMLSVLSGSIDDGYGGILGWFWVACAVTTIGLSLVTTAALRERAYSAVMAATGLLYLAILTAFGTDLVARLVLAS
jgi:hypothetical protein